MSPDQVRLLQSETARELAQNPARTGYRVRGTDAAPTWGGLPYVSIGGRQIPAWWIVGGILAAVALYRWAR